MNFTFFRLLKCSLQSRRAYLVKLSFWVCLKFEMCYKTRRVRTLDFTVCTYRFTISRLCRVAKTRILDKDQSCYCNLKNDPCFHLAVCLQNADLNSSLYSFYDWNFCYTYLHLLQIIVVPGHLYLDTCGMIQQYRYNSMTSLLAHTVAQPTKWRFYPRIWTS